MRAYDIAIFSFMFMLSLSLFTQLGITSDTIGGLGMGSTGLSAEDYTSQQTADLNSTLVGDTVDPANVFNWFGAVYKFVFLGIPMVIKILLDSTILIPVMLHLVGVPDILNGILTSAVWLIYCIGILQWVTGKSMREQQ
jgi:hypothetical protein